MADWSEDTRELAYQLWAFVHGRSARAVAAALATEHGAAVPVRTVQHWASSGRWSERAAAELSAIAPDLHAGIVADLVLGAIDAARTLRRSVAEGAGTDRPDKVQVQAALALLDRAGYSPLGRVAPARIDAPAAALALPDVSALALADVDAAERLYLERLRVAHADRLRATRRDA